MARHIRNDGQLSDENCLKGKLQRACLAIMTEHEERGELPTSVRFIYYELVQRRILSKSDKRATARLGDALMYLRETGRVPWEWIVDETRDLDDYTGFENVEDGVEAAINGIRLDPWEGDAPTIITESRSIAGVLRDIADEYRVKIASTNGQAGGFLRTELREALSEGARVLYIGDHDHQGNQIENNTRTVLEDQVGEIDWERIALTETQVGEYNLGHLVIMKSDNRYKPPREHPAVETEALQQSVIMQIVRDKLDELLPEPLSDVVEREQREREEIRERFNRDDKPDGYLG
jgi:hypothetical protein